MAAIEFRYQDVLTVFGSEGSLPLPILELNTFSHLADPEKTVID
jgi:hypothetical protein